MKKLGIIVGNSTYKNLSNLDCCSADASAIKELIDYSAEFDAVELIENKVALDLKDTIRDALNDIGNVKEVFFYFSGHGAQINDEFFFCASDFDSKKPNETGLSLSEFHTLLRSSGATLVVSVIDACSSGNLLIKSDGSFLPEIKSNFQDFIQIASCLDSQYSYSGNPLSPFTRIFIEGAVQRTTGPVYYSDIINYLRDSFLSNGTQTPHFISQGTGREKLSEDAGVFATIRQRISLNSVNVQANSKEVGVLSISERLKEIDAKFVTREDAELAIGSLFDEAQAAFESDSVFSETFDCTFQRLDSYQDQKTDALIVESLAKTTRPDSFVSVWKTYDGKLNPPSILSGGILSRFNSLDKGKVEYHVNLNCSIKEVQFQVIMLPKFRCVKKYSIVLSCIPSLEKLYIFEIVCSHKLTDWDNHGAGSVINERWYRLDWSDDRSGIVKNLRDYIEESFGTLAEIKVDNDTTE